LRPPENSSPIAPPSGPTVRARLGPCIPAWTLIGTFALLLLTMVRPPHSVTAGSSAKARGTELFATKGCAHCHGPAGVGGGKGPDLQLVRTRLHRGQIVAQIHDGGKSMPDFGDQLTPGQIDDLATYLLAKRKLIPVPPQPTPPPAQPSPTKDPD
jgi:mono/diheme cytochrome c family protein